MWFFGRKGASGFSHSSTAEEVTDGIDGSGLTAIVTGHSSLISMHFLVYHSKIVPSYVNTTPETVQVLAFLLPSSFLMEFILISGFSWNFLMSRYFTKKFVIFFFVFHIYQSVNNFLCISTSSTDFAEIQVWVLGRINHICGKSLTQDILFWMVFEDDQQVLPLLVVYSIFFLIWSFPTAVGLISLPRVRLFIRLAPASPWPHQHFYCL